MTPNPLPEIIALLEPIAEQDWHGKWRIQKAIALARAADDMRKNPDNLNTSRERVQGMDMSLVERVARIIAGPHPDENDGGSPPKAHWEYCIPTAKAVIAAMQEGKTSWTCPDCCKNPCACEVYPKGNCGWVEIEDFRGPPQTEPLGWWWNVRDKKIELDEILIGKDAEIEGKGGCGASNCSHVMIAHSNQLPPPPINRKELYPA